MAAKVLLVEDDNNLREIYEARLLAEGYVIVTAKDGEEALVVAKAEKPDLIISDVMMPRISGFEMLDILRNTEELKYTKVIMLTALGQADDKTRANSLGADRYLVKSQVTLEDIVKAAHELIGDLPVAPMAPAAAAPAVPTPPSPPAAPAAAVAMTAAEIPVVAPPAPVAASAPAAAAPAVPTPPSPPAAPANGMLVNQPQPNPAPAPLSPMATQNPMPPQVVETNVPPVTPTASFGQPEINPPATPASLPTTATTAEEEASVDTQIQAFVNKPDITPPAAPVGMSPAAVNAASDDAVLASAVNDLGTSGAVKPPLPPVFTPPSPMEPASPPAAGLVTPSPTPAPAVPTPPVTPTAPADDEGGSDGASVQIANKKVIQPLKAEPGKPGLNELLAREEANTIMTNGYNPAAAVVSPESPSGIPPSGAPAMPLPPPQPPKPNDFDPNNFSL